MSTASRNCRFHQQRLQVVGLNAPLTFGSFGGGPWALRPKRLQWLTNITAGFEIAAFRKSVLSLMALYNSTLSICGLEAVAGTSPPSSFRQFSQGPPIVMASF